MSAPEKNYAKLLSRGGTSLGLAMCALAETPPSALRWNVLAPQKASQADEIIEAIDSGVDPSALSSALAAAMGSRSPVAPPAWTEPLWSDPIALVELGERLGPICWPPGSETVARDPRERTLAHLAVAFSRNLDSARAMAERMEPGVGACLVEMTRLAACAVEPGEPSAVRAELKKILADDQNG